MDIRPHTLLIAMHLSAVAVGLGVALVADWVVLAKLTFKTVTPRNARQLADLSQVVAAGLALIWITGLTLVVHNASVAPRAVQRCRFAVTESALQHLMVEMWRLIARGIPEPAVV